ncbi:MAG: hypothetical protein GOMPHAMPRED_004668 [Gomphillus americanus]|uniref:ATP-dependent RNA helicase n=1 Tax=Gomphillus americanus TaxID=1940652 RepID=A0A8H3FV73_9LECA|nr:MAG: hypothetical protein GOMPHAMPRED_004668 [Gomphillus americanus]
MDPFKLLTKGTKLSAKSQDGRLVVLPSAGPAKTPQTLAVGVIVPEQDAITKGTKRKRTTSSSTEKPLSSVPPQVPDFFSHGTTADVPIVNNKAINDIQHPGSTDDTSELSFVRKSEIECQQILRRHKIKLTLMKSVASKKRINGKKVEMVQLTPQPLEDFASLRSRFKISKRLAGNLVQLGYTLPTEVQLGAIPLLLGNDEDRGLHRLPKWKNTGKSHVDLLSVAPTGSGKTLAFLIPVIQGLLNSKHESSTSEEANTLNAHIKAIILAPTHELADQIVNESRKLVQGTGLKVSGMKKGMRILIDQDDKNSAGEVDSIVKADLLISTPMALANVIASDSSEARTVPSIHYLVMDEADVLLDPLFREQTVAIWNACTNPGLQVSFWSATIGASIENLAQELIITRRKELKIPSKNHYILRVIAGLKDSAIPIVSHRLTYAATEQGKLLAIRQILRPTGFEYGHSLRPPFLVFTQTISRATALHSELLYDIPFEAGGSNRIAVLHSSLSDTARSDIMTRFRRGEIWILITTDLLSRGIDFRGVNGIVNYDIPTTSAAYVHRAGRTGRAGREGGIAITLYTKEDIPYVKNIANVIAASERVHGKKSSEQAGESLPRWLLDALPNVSKKTKKELKKRGVKERAAGFMGSSVRISTKSGFQRQLEDKKKGARAASQKKTLESEVEAEHEQLGSESEWGGLED